MLSWYHAYAQGRLSIGLANAKLNDAFKIITPKEYSRKTHTIKQGHGSEHDNTYWLDDRASILILT